MFLGPIEIILELQARQRRRGVVDTLSRYWWAPTQILLILVAYLGLFSIVSGLLATFPGVASRESNGRWWLIAFSGAAWGLIGILTLFWPGIPNSVVLVLITGTIEITASIKLQKFLPPEWLMIAMGTLSMLFVWLLISFRSPGALSVVRLIGIYAMALGILQIVLSLKLREIKNRYSLKTYTSNR